MNKIRARQLSNEIEGFLTQRIKANKKLARDVAAWIDTAMRTKENAKGGSVNDDDGKDNNNEKVSEEEEDKRVMGNFSWFF